MCMSTHTCVYISIYYILYIYTIYGRCTRTYAYNIHLPLTFSSSISPRHTIHIMDICIRASAHITQTYN